jgi:hypothetical protein
MFIFISVVAQMIWYAILRPKLEGEMPPPASIPEVLKMSFGVTLERYQQMVGSFGWLDTAVPTITWVLWSAAIALLILTALAWANRRYVVALLVLIVAVIAVPVLFDAVNYQDVGLVWQGRYALPIAVGVPILAGMAIASTEAGHQLSTPRFLLVIGIVASVGQVLAFAQNLRRYTVGSRGELQFWKHPQWAPLTGPLLVTIAYATVVSAFVAWLLIGSKRVGSASR